MKRVNKSNDNQCNKLIKKICLTNDATDINDEEQENATITNETASNVDYVDIDDKSEKNSTKTDYKTYFNIITEKDKNKYGICLLCEKMRKSVKIKMKNSNTSGLKKHLSSIHKHSTEKKINNSLREKGQQDISDIYNLKGKFRDCDKDKLYVCWLAYKKLSYNFFDDDIAQKFFKSINPNEQMPRRKPMQRKVNEQFEEMKNNLKTLLAKNESKFSFTIDAWTARNSKSFYGVTIHYIDSNWEFQGLALDFIASKGKHTGKNIASFFLGTVKDFNIQNKIQGITADNASANSTFMFDLQLLLEKENLKFNAKDQHFRCIAHILNLAVQDVLKLLNVDVNDKRNLLIAMDESEEQDGNSNLPSEQDSNSGNFDCVTDDSDDNETETNFDSTNYKWSAVVSNIRQTCKKIRHSEVLTIRLQSFCSAADIKYSKPILDVRTRWSSTFDMLNVAFELKTAFVMLWENCTDVKDFKISEDEWTGLQRVLKFLGNFKQISTLLSAENYSTLPLVIVTFNLLLDKIEKLVFDLDNQLHRTVTDEMLLLAFQAGRDKMIKHYNKTNWIYCVSLILDPRHKLDAFDLTVWGRNLKDETVKKFSHIFQNDYFSHETELNVASSMEKNVNEKEDEDIIDLNAIYLKNDEAVNDNWETEMTNYLTAPRAKMDTDILQWWKMHQASYPHLAKMARDILSVMATSVPVERLFSNASLIMTNRRTSLNDFSLRSLICINSWMKSKLKSDICQCDL